MPVIITPSGVAPTQYIAPADGDFVDGASVQLTAQPLVDQVDRLTQKVAGARLLYEQVHGLPTPASAYRFLFDTTFGWVQSSVVVAGEIWFPLGPFPRNQADAPLYLAEVTVNVIAASGHGALPATMPQFSIYGFPDGFLQILDSPFVDTSATAGVYNNEHQINGVLSVPIALDFINSPSGNLFIKFEGETGANSIEGFTVLSIKTALQETV